MKYLFIINQNASTGKIKKIIPSLLELIKSKKFIFDYHLTQSLDEVPEIIKKSDEFDVIVSVGGDGTLNGILNCLINSDKIIGVVPLGTGNDFPIMINVTKNIDNALETIINGKVKEIDVGYLVTEKYRKYFINAVGVGFDAKVGYTKNEIRFIDGGLSKYILSLFSSLITYKTPQIKIELDESHKFEKKCFLITVGNGKRTGGGFLLTPDAEIDDGLFDVCIIDEVSRLKVTKEFTKVLKGLHTSMPEVAIYRTNRVLIQSSEELYLHYDGETPGLVKNIQISLIPKKMKILTNL